MKYLAKGSVFFGIVALMMALFYFQPHVEAALVKASEAQTQLNTKQVTKTKVNQFTEQLYTPGAAAKAIDDPETDSESSKELMADAVAYKATAYCLRGRTASGSNVRKGIVAADPRVLPLGTRIQLSAGSYSGTYTVADTGGAIKGRILDIWVPSCSEAIRFGRKSVKVSVLSSKKKKK